MLVSLPFFLSVEALTLDSNSLSGIIPTSISLLTNLGTLF